MSPTPVPPTTWRLEPPPDDHPGDLWAIGADLEPGTLLAAYGLGLFPMPFGDTIGWFSPARRAIVPLAEYAPARSLRRAARRYEIRVDAAFGDVIRGCARPGDPASWIDPEIVAAYEALHQLGWAHSVEAYDDEGLAGGLYGIALGGLFAAESMFFRRADASKAAFAALVRRLQATDAESRLLDVQWPTPHLASLGAVDVSRREYRQRLTVALTRPSPFVETSV